MKGAKGTAVIRGSGRSLSITLGQQTWGLPSPPASQALSEGLRNWLALFWRGHHSFRGLISCVFIKQYLQSPQVIRTGNICRLWKEVCTTSFVFWTCRGLEFLLWEFGDEGKRDAVKKHKNDKLLIFMLLMIKRGTFFPFKKTFHVVTMEIWAGAWLLLGDPNSLLWSRVFPSMVHTPSFSSGTVGPGLTARSCVLF